MAVERIINPYHLEMLKALVCFKLTDNFLVYLKDTFSPIGVRGRRKIDGDLRLKRMGFNISEKTHERFFTKGESAQANFSITTLSKYYCWLKENKNLNWSAFEKEYELPFGTDMPLAHYQNLSETWKKRVYDAIVEELGKYKNYEAYCKKEVFIDELPNSYKEILSNQEKTREELELLKESDIIQRAMIDDLTKKYNELKAHISYRPDCNDVLIKKARFYINKRNYPGAKRLLKKSLQSNVLNIEESKKAAANDTFELAMLGYIQANYYEAIEYANQSIGYNNKYAGAWNIKGASFFKVNRYGDALEAYEQALVLKKKDAEIIYNKGLALYELQEYDKAIDVLNSAIKIKRNLPEAWNILSSSYFMLGNYQEALKASEKSIKYNPQFSKAWSNKGICLAELGKPHEAIEALVESTELDNKNGITWYNLACIYARVNDKSNALKSLKRSINLDIENKISAQNEADFKEFAKDPSFKKMIK